MFNDNEKWWFTVWIIINPIITDLGKDLGTLFAFYLVLVDRTWAAISRKQSDVKIFSGPLPRRRHLLSQRQAILQEKRGKTELKHLRRKIEKNEIASNAVALFAKKMETGSGNETKFKKILQRHWSAGQSTIFFRNCANDSLFFCLKFQFNYLHHSNF